MKSKYFFSLLLAVYVFFGAMVFSESPEILTTPEDQTQQKVSEDDISVYFPDMDLLYAFQEKEAELDALGASRSHFIEITKSLLKYWSITSQRRSAQEEKIREIRRIQWNIKKNKALTEQQKTKLEKDISLLESEIALLEKKQKETTLLLKKFYQEDYMKEIQWDKDMTLMTLLLPKTFGNSIKESEILDIMKTTSQNLISRQKENYAKIQKIQTTIQEQKNQKTRLITRMERYDAELATAEDLEIQLLWRTIQRQWAIKNTLTSNKKNTQTLTQKFEQKFAEYEKNIEEYTQKYNCKNQKSALCNWINGYKKAEKELRMQEERVSSFIWPISTEKWFWFHFRDQKYHNLHQSHHTGLDIITAANMPIKAINDGYIIAVKKPEKWSPWVLIMKHRNGFMTVYKNIQIKKGLDVFTLVKKWDLLWNTWTYAEHSNKNNLHVEMYLRWNLIDPIEKMSFEHTNIKNIPSRYGWKYIDDIKKSQKDIDVPNIQKTIGFFYIPGENELERQKNMINKYAWTAFRDHTMWIEESISESVDPSFVLCVWFAESTLGQNLTTPGNIGNVGNTDGGDRRDYDGPRSGIRAIAAVVNNQWLWHYQTIDQLSWWWNPRGPIYASSPTNWHENIVKCMSALKGKYVGNYTAFRLNQADLLSYEKAGYKRKVDTNVIE